MMGALVLYFCFFLCFSGVFEFPHLFPPHSQETAMSFVLVASAMLQSLAQSLFPFIPKEEQRLSPLVLAFIVSRPPEGPAAGAGSSGVGQGVLPCIEWWGWKELPNSCLFPQLCAASQTERTMNSFASENSNVWHAGEALI